MARGDVRQAIDNLLAQGGAVTTGEVAALAGVSRQAAQKQLKALVAAGRLTVQGKARAARYLAVDDSRTGAGPVDDAAPWSHFPQPAADETGPGLRALAPLLTSAPVDDSARAGRVRLTVADAGAEFRLSARILLCEVTAAELVVDFAGVEDVADEFLDELLVRYAEAHPEVHFEIVNAAAAIRAAVARLQRPAQSQRLALSP